MCIERTYMHAYENDYCSVNYIQYLVQITTYST